MTTPLLSRAAPPGEIAVVADSARALRDAMGPDGAFAIDFHGRADVLTARRLIAAVAEFSPLFVEEPVLPDQQDMLIRLAGAAPVPIATGERLYSRAEVTHLLPSAVDILQPDVSNAAGISELRRIATLADTYGIELAPHCAIGPVALAASLQVCFASPNALIQERDLEWARPHALRYVPDLSGFDVAGGHVELPTRPGLGIDVDETAVRAAAGVASRHPPNLSHADGSFQEW
jgi:galactonate dehydratase